ncbi:helix-turn-helix transcriptional regulator [Chryseobacterium sp. MA9]|uniref:helix-turn-helix transcriptional regulator n=1 Tax=Chryseobacterium sp. MA9 TaxID=2966625 RepID=UPI002107267A|nr:helix-turn-helix transcriptional regulator [Chryseobacterium sp. MA9]UTX48864.1 helix-turn-helix transcriptional regulator [Chryseobacterium sp. MA9]
MKEYSNDEIYALGLQIGCIIRTERLKKKISQEDLGLLIGSNSTTIGRIERYENSTSWELLIKICQSLEIDFYSLFKLHPLSYILMTIKEALSLETKLTKQKEQYYSDLEKTVKLAFKKIKT